MPYAITQSPVGELTIVSDDDAIVGLYFANHRGGFGGHKRAGGGGASILDDAVKQLDAYFAGERTTFDLALRPSGTPFQLAVWAQLRQIPFGETISYGQLAKRVGIANGSRAVGMANGRNPISILIPCHRVIGADGSLTGFGGGVDVKRKLLDLEGATNDSALFARV